MKLIFIMLRDDICFMKYAENLFIRLSMQDYYKLYVYNLICLAVLKWRTILPVLAI